MLTTKKVLEDAIKVREDELNKLHLKWDNDHEGLSYSFYQYDIKNLESQIAELKQSLQDVFEAHNKRQSLV